MSREEMKQYIDKKEYDPAWFEGDEAHELDRQALRALVDMGATLREIRLPDLPVDELLYNLNVESAAAFEELTLSGRDDLLRQQIDEAWPNYFRFARFFSAIDYVQADRLRRKVMEEAHRFFEPVDVVFGPSFNTPMLTLTNYTGHPGLAIRAGFEELAPRALFGHPENDTDTTVYRVPRSVSLWSGLFQEGKLITVGRALEAALGVADARPPL